MIYLIVAVIVFVLAVVIGIVFEGRKSKHIHH